jgi:hypothetical protein
MELTEATRQARVILIEEQKSPTVNYELVSADCRVHMQSLTDAMRSTPPQADVLNIYTMRTRRPRPVTQAPQLYVFKSVNYELLRTLYEQIHADDRSQFVEEILKLVKSGTTTHKEVHGARFPHFENYTSCLPMLAEFCIRTDNAAALFKTLQDVKMPTRGIAIMLKQLEETIALNYDLFTQIELDEIPAQLENLHHVAELQTYRSRGPRGGKQVPNPNYRGGYEKIGREIISAIDGITEECRKAVFYYVKDSLQKRPNLEVERDKTTVEDYLAKLGFDAQMAGSLNAAETEYRSATNQFDLKNSLGHLRSFLEHLHRESARAIAAAAGLAAGNGWNKATIFLRDQGFITKQHEAFVTSLYTLLSDESVHPLGAAPEYARLLRNVVIEYGVMFLSVLDGQGVKIITP